MTGLKRGTNPIAERHMKRYNELPQEAREKLDELDTWNWREHQLLKLKRSKIPPAAGDVFVFSPREGIYFFGKVLEDNIRHRTRDVTFDGKSVVFLFKTKSRVKDGSNFVPDYSNLFSKPMIVDASYWTKGYFETVAHQDISVEEKKLKYGFYNSLKPKIFHADGSDFDGTPCFVGIYGISTIMAVAIEVEMEAVFDPDLFIFD